MSTRTTSSRKSGAGCKALFASAMLTAAAFAPGCATVSYSSPGMLDGVEVKGSEAESPQLVVIQTDGFYMLWTLPIATGDLRWNDKKKSIEGGCHFFSDQVGINELQNALEKIADSRNCDLMDIIYSDSDLSFGCASYEGIIGFLFNMSRMSVSAILVPRDSKEESL